MQKDDKIRISHMLSAAREAQSFTRNETRASIEKDRKLTLALVKAVEIIGEAASKISNECQNFLAFDCICHTHLLLYKSIFTTYHTCRD